MPVVIHCKLGFHLGVNGLKDIQMLKNTGENNPRIQMWGFHHHDCGVRDVANVHIGALGLS